MSDNRVSIDDALDWFRAATTALSAIGDGANIPALKGAAGLAGQIVGIVQVTVSYITAVTATETLILQTIRNNKEDALDLARETFEDIQALANACDADTRVEANDMFLESVRALET